MRDDMDTKLVELLDYVGQVARDADGLVRAQAPLVAQEIVAWYTWSSVLGMVVGVAMVVTSVVFLRRTPRMSDDDSICLTMVLCSVGLVLGLFGTGHSVANLVKVSTAPRVMVLEYVKGAMR